MTLPAALSGVSLLGAILFLLQRVFTRAREPKFNAPMLYDERKKIDLVAHDRTIKTGFQKVQKLALKSLIVMLSLTERSSSKASSSR